jgi:hypothetical protein
MFVRLELGKQKALLVAAVASAKLRVMIQLIDSGYPLDRRYTELVDRAMK